MEPTKVIEFSDARVSLWIGVSLKLAPDLTVLADRMEIDHTLGTTENVLVLMQNGVRTVLRVQQVMQLQGSHPDLPVRTSAGQTVEPVEPTDAVRLLKIYDRFEARTYRD